MTTTTSTAPSSIKAGPWVDEDRSKSDPLPLADEFDDRPCVRDLIQQHETRIREIGSKIQSDPCFNPHKHDDLWILRFALSHKSNKKAADCAIQFMHYRHERNLDETDIRENVPGRNCPIPGVRQFYEALDDDDCMLMTQPDPNRGVLMVKRIAGFDQSKIADIANDDWPFWYFLEWMFQRLDSVTRRTGRLTKGIRFMDLYGYHHIRQGNKECIHRNAASARETTEFYPQMLATVFVLNAPVWGQVVFSCLKPLLPRSFVQKIVVFNPRSKKDYLSILKHLSPENIPIQVKAAIAMATTTAPSEKRRLESIIQDEKQHALTATASS
ncbi:SEC14 cytosolic factor [Fragilaria crotonensis]|nr:SEC14 cytosolic factor [Fragilaria crotonensis]